MNSRFIFCLVALASWCSCSSRITILSPCEPLDTAPLWLTEGENVVIQLACNQPGALSERTLHFEGLPSGARYDREQGVLSWTPGLHQAAVYEIELQLPASDESATIFIGVADAHQHPDNEPVQDPKNYTEEFGVPVLFLDAAPSESKYSRVTVTSRGHQYDAEAKLRGQSSLAYPKKNYTLKFDGDDPFAPSDLGGPLVPRRKVVLVSSYDDNAYVRPRLALDLWNAMDPEHLQIQSASVVLYVDGRYHGLYTLADHVNRHLMAAHGLLDTGNLYQQNTYAADLRVEEPLHAGVEKTEGEPKDDFSDFDELVTFIDTSSDEEFRARIGERVDLRDYMDWWVFVTILRAEDTASKNTYHYFERPGVPARFAPWDFNASFGQAWTTHRLSPLDVPVYTRVNRLFERFLFDPELSVELETRRRALLDGVFHPDHVDALVDGYLEEIGDAAARDWSAWESHHRGFFRWANRTDFTSFEEEVRYLRGWYRERWQRLRGGAVAAGGAEPEPAPGNASGSPGSPDR